MFAAYVIARPSRWLVILSLAIMLANLLELAQVLTVLRHGKVNDALFMMASCGIGVLLGLAGDFVCGRVAVSLRVTREPALKPLHWDV